MDSVWYKAIKIICKDVQISLVLCHGAFVPVHTHNVWQMNTITCNKTGEYISYPFIKRLHRHRLFLLLQMHQDRSTLWISCEGILSNGYMIIDSIEFVETANIVMESLESAWSIFQTSLVPLSVKNMDFSGKSWSFFSSAFKAMFISSKVLKTFSSFRNLVMSWNYLRMTFSLTFPMTFATPSLFALLLV